MPDVRSSIEIDKNTPVLKVENLTKSVEVKTGAGFRGKKQISIVENVSLQVRRGETLAIVGESGSGKTTLLRALSMISPPTSGKISLNGELIYDGKPLMKRLGGRIQMVFQDPDTSLNPTMDVKGIVAEPLRHSHYDGNSLEEIVKSSLKNVGLGEQFFEKHPAQLSGGQKQRVSIARALSSSPSVVLLDEPTSALDAAVQAQVLNLLLDLQARLQLTYLLVTHNISVARYMADRIAVFYAGSVREMGPSESILMEPLHPYTSTLISAFPILDAHKRNLLQMDIVGEPPSVVNPPKGCSFHPRCPYVKDVCRANAPPLVGYFNDHYAACHFALEIRDNKIPIAGKAS